MTKKQMIALFICSLIPWTVGNGLVPLLPIYAIELGADPAIAGYYLAFSYFALAVGTVAAGWFSDRFQHRKIPLIVAGVVGVPAAWLIGRVGNMWELSVLTALLWFCGGLGLSFIGILAGLSAGEDERGKVFGILSLTGGFGALIGGLATGYIADRWDFQTMFTATSGFMAVWPLASIFLTEKRVEQGQGESGGDRQESGLGRNFNLLFTASLISSISGFIIVLGRSILMNDLVFDSLAIASTGAVGGAIAMPLPLLMGWLSDRTDRKLFLFIGYLSGMVSLSVLVVSTFLWHFWIISVLETIFVAVNGTIGNAMVTDMVPRESLGRGLALFSATGWIGGVLGFAGAGYALQSLGQITTFIIGICLILVAVVLVIPVRSAAR